MIRMLAAARKITSRLGRLAFVASTACGIALFSSVELRAQIPDECTNLKVLPKEISKAELVQTMKSFTWALGVRCEHCHSYRAGVDPSQAKFSDFDFPADAREAKVKAREMMKMVHAINTDYLAKLAGRSNVQVRCVTCHHGVTIPETIDARIERKIADEGIEAAIADYRELRGEYLTSGAYDFDEGPLGTLGERLIKGGKAEAASSLLSLNAEFHPDSAWTQYLLGEALLAGSDRDAAKAAFAKSLELEPDNPPAKKRLAELSAEAPKP